MSRLETAYGYFLLAGILLRSFKCHLAPSTNVSLKKKKTKKNCKTCFFIDKIDSHKTVSESVAGLMRFLNGVDIEEEQAAHFHPFKLKMLTVRGE